MSEEHHKMYLHAIMPKDCVTLVGGELCGLRFPHQKDRVDESNTLKLLILLISL